MVDTATIVQMQKALFYVQNLHLMSPSVRGMCILAAPMVRMLRHANIEDVELRKAIENGMSSFLVQSF